MNARRVVAGFLIVVVLAIATGLAVRWMFDRAYGPKTVPEHSVSNADTLIEFREFPVYWLGMEYDGLPLTALRVAAEPGSSTHQVVLGYGFCKTRGGLDGSSCTPPLLLIEQPPCTIDPTSYDAPGETTRRYVWRRGVGIYLQTSTMPIAQAVGGLTLANDASFDSEPLVDTPTFQSTLRGECSTTVR